MTPLLRLLAVLFVVPATFFFVYWLPFSLIPVDEQRIIALVGSLVCALAAGWFVWTRLASLPEGLASSAVSGGLLVGGIAFCAGFFGPIIFTPEANQGPLLGIFVTGPLGFVAGLAGGTLAWWIRRKKRAQ